MKASEQSLGKSVGCRRCKKKFNIPIIEEPTASAPTKDPSHLSTSDQDWAKFKKELTGSINLWNKLEKELKDLRDSGKIEGRIAQSKKIEMIITIKKDFNSDFGKVFEIIKRDFPEFLIKSEQKPKGCLGLVIFGAVLFGSLSIKILNG